MTQYDSHYGFDDDAARKFSWARVAGFSFAIALHVSAFMLMLTPTAPAANYGASEDTSYRRYRPPRYPPQAVRQRQEGEVVLRVLVGIDGSPAQIEIEKSSRSRLLDRAAMDAVREWKFNPGMRDGKAIQSWVLVPISFKLSDL